MHSLSVWASKHVWPARIMIILGHFINTLLALFIGNSLGLFNFFLPAVLFYAAIALFLFVFLLYPHKQLRHRFRNFYRRQKACDALLIFITFVLVLCIGNQPHRFLPFAAQPAAATAGFSTNLTVDDPGLKSKTALRKHSKKALRQVLLQKIRVLRKAYKHTSTGGKIALIVLSVAVAVGLLYLLAALSCSLSCSGSEGAALVVLILGVSLITFLLIKVIHRILKGPKRVETPAST